MEQLLQGAKWEILSAISKGSSSATELAQRTGSSLPNISQQMRLLEAYDLVEYQKEQRTGAGKPRQLYRLKRDVAHLTVARKGFAQKRFLALDAYHAAMLGVLFVPRTDDHAFLHKLLLTCEEIMHECAVAHLRSGEDIELLLVTESLAAIRSKYSHVTVTVNGKPRKVVAWTHSVAEINDGLARKDQYFEHLMRSPLVIHDPKGQFERIRKIE